MESLIFATTNKTKFELGATTCQAYGIELVRKPLEIDEIQGEDMQKIALDKAYKAFDNIKLPVIISDDAWAFHGLNGFPGAYMHSMNHWFSPQDFLNLTLPLTDRNVTLTQTLVYQDKDRQRLFNSETHGTILKELRGPLTQPNHMIITLDGDNGLSIAERYDSGKPHNDRAAAKVWHDFATWYTKKQ